MQKKASQAQSDGLSYRDLWLAFWKNPESGTALSNLFEAFLPMVSQVVSRMAINLPSHVAVQDLMQAASLGLYHTINRFDPEQGRHFEAFAYPRIRGAVLDELRQMDHLSRATRTQLKKVEQTIRQWASDHGENPCEEDLARSMGVSTDELATLLDQAQPWLSLDDLVVQGDSDSLTLQEVLADTSAPTAEEEAEKNDLRERLRRAFLNLSAREQKILYLYYFEELRLGEIAAIYELTEARICQLHALAVAKLRAELSMSE